MLGVSALRQPDPTIVAAKRQKMTRTPKRIRAPQNAQSVIREVPESYQRPTASVKQIPALVAVQLAPVASFPRPVPVAPTAGELFQTAGPNRLVAQYASGSV